MTVAQAIMEAQRLHTRDPSNAEYETTATGESLPPPPAAFPISEFSRISAQLLEATPAPRVTETDSSSPSELGRNPFGDSNAVSRNSIASTTSESQRDPFRHEADDQSFRDDASSLAPPPEYEEFAGGIGVESGVVGRRASDGTPLPSYTAVARDLGKQESRNGAVSSVSRTSSSYPQEKAESTEEKVAQRPPEEVRPSVPEMRERSRAELSAISDAISRVYASSPSLDNQRATPSSSRPTSRSGLAEDDPERTGLSGKLSSLLLGKSMDGKGKRKESKTRAEDEESVVIEGRRMSRTMADDLLQIWDNIDRAHGHRLHDQSQEKDPDWEAAKLEAQKKAFYQELMSKTGQGRLASQEYSGTSRLNKDRPLNTAYDSEESVLGPPVDHRHPFQSLSTPDSESASRADDTTGQSSTAAPGTTAADRQTELQNAEEIRRPSPETKTSEDDLVTMQDFIQRTEQELVTVQDFFKNEYGKHK